MCDLTFPLLVLSFPGRKTAWQFKPNKARSNQTMTKGGVVLEWWLVSSLKFSISKKKKTQKISYYTEDLIASLPFGWIQGVVNSCGIVWHFYAVPIALCFMPEFNNRLGRVLAQWSMGLLLSLKYHTTKGEEVIPLALSRYDTPM